MYIGIPTCPPVCVEMTFRTCQEKEMSQNNTSDAPASDRPDLSGSSELRGPNLTDLGHTGPKTGDEALTTDEQHREMSQHEYRSQDDDGDGSDIIAERHWPAENE
jgi:hypothetical protein